MGYYKSKTYTKFCKQGILWKSYSCHFITSNRLGLEDMFRSSVFNLVRGLDAATIKEYLVKLALASIIVNLVLIVQISQWWKWPVLGPSWDFAFKTSYLDIIYYIYIKITFILIIIFTRIYSMLPVSTTHGLKHKT